MRFGKRMMMAVAVAFLTAGLVSSAVIASTARHCSGHLPGGGFFSGLTAINTTCSTARAVVRQFSRVSGFSQGQGFEDGQRERFNGWSCIARIRATDENGTGKFGCRKGRQQVRWRGHP